MFVDRLLTRSILTEEEQQVVLRLPTHAMQVQSRQDFVLMNEEATYSCLIVSGLVGRFGQTVDGSRQITALHIPGDMADLHSAVRPIGVGGLMALCPTTVLRVPHDAIRALAARYPAIAEALWRDCMLDAAILMEWVVDVGRRNSQTRLAHVLCEMSIRAGGGREATLDYAFPITQEHLGDAAGLTPVHVNRSLKILREQELATLKGGRVRIHDWEALASAGEFDASYLVADTAPARQKRLLATI
jgi:CRP-like cAMP-binding protein